MSTRWIAEQRVVFVHADGRRVAGRIAVAAPTQSAENASCVVALDGLASSHPIHWESTLQAMLLALQLAGWELHRFTASGGRVLDPDEDTDIPLEAIFGPLLRPAPMVGPKS
jgi:hypothetical protein